MHLRDEARETVGEEGGGQRKRVTGGSVLKQTTTCGRHGHTWRMRNIDLTPPLSLLHLVQLSTYFMCMQSIIAAPKSHTNPYDKHTHTHMYNGNICKLFGKLWHVLMHE